MMMADTASAQSSQTHFCRCCRCRATAEEDETAKCGSLHAAGRMFTSGCIYAARRYRRSAIAAIVGTLGGIQRAAFSAARRYCSLPRNKLSFDTLSAPILTSSAGSFRLICQLAAKARSRRRAARTIHPPVPVLQIRAD